MPNQIRNALKGSRKLMSKFGGKLSPEEEKMHRLLVRVGGQMAMTVNVINGNSDKLAEIAKTDEKAAKLLTDLAKGEQGMMKSYKKILDRQDLSKKEASALINGLENVASDIGDLGISLDVSVGSVVNDLSSQIMDDRIDRDERRTMVKHLSGYVSKMTSESSGLSDEKLAGIASSLDKLEGLGLDTLNFDKKESVNLRRILTEVSDETLEVKTRSTLETLNNNLDESILNQKELSDVLDQQSGGKSFKDKFMENPGLASMGKTMKGGITSMLLGSLGLGGIDQAFGIGDMVGDMSFGRGARKVGGRGGRGIGGLLGRGKGLLGKVGGIGGSLLGLGGGGGGQFAMDTMDYSPTRGVKQGGLASKMGRVGKGVGKGGFGMLKGAGKMALKGAKFIPGIGQALAAGMAIYEGFDGWNNAEEIGGLEKGQKATTGQKAQAATSSVLSGLTLGLVDPKTIFKKLTSVMGFFMDEKTGIFPKIASFFGKLWDALPDWDTIVKPFKIGFTAIFGDKGMMTKVGGFFKFLWEKGKSFVSWYYGGIWDAVTSLFGENGFFGKIAGFFSNFGSNMMDGMTAILSPSIMIDKIKDGMQGIFDFFFNEKDGIFHPAAIANIVKKSLSGGILGGVMNMFSSDEGGEDDGTSVLDKITGMFGSKSELPEMATGGYVGKTGLFRLHKGETVIPDKVLVNSKAMDLLGAEMASSNNKSQIIAPPMPAANPGQRAPTTSKQTHIDDYGLAFINSAVFEGGL